MTEPITLTAEDQPVIAGAAKLAKRYGLDVSTIYKLSKENGAPVTVPWMATKKWFIEDWDQFMRGQPRRSAISSGRAL